MAYASKYYDPVKAHEYYEKHKQLKGRKRKRGSTAGMSDKGKSVAAYVKERITTQKKADIAEISARLSDKIAEMRAELKEKLQGLSKEEKAELKAEYKERIAGIREAYKQWKSNVREYYKEQYINEVEKMQASGEFKRK